MFNIAQDQNTLATVAQYRAQADGYCKDWHSNIRRWRELYNLIHYTVGAKPGEEQYPDPTPQNVVDLAVGVLLANGLEWRAFGFAPGHKERKDSSRIEKILAGLLFVNSDREGYDIIYENTLQMVRDGTGVLYTVWDQGIADNSLTSMPMEDEQTGQQRVVPVFTEPPLRVQVVDPLELFFIPGGKGRFNHICRVVMMTPYEVESLFGVQLKSAKYAGMSEVSKKDVSQRAELINYWCTVEIMADEPIIGPDGMPRFNQVLGKPETQRKRKTAVQQALVYGGEVVWPLSIVPGYKEIPFVFGFFKPTSRLDAKEWYSIIRPIEESVTMLEKLTNRRVRQITVMSALPLVAKTQLGRTVQVDPALIDVVPLGLDEDLAFPQWPGNPPDVELQMSFFRDRIMQGGFAEMQQMAQQRSGYAISQMYDQSRLRLEQPIKQLEGMWGNWAKQAMQLITFFAPNHVLRVYGQLRGQDFVEQTIGTDLADYLVRAMIRAKFPNDEVRKHAMASQIRGTLSTYTVMEKYLDIEQPDDEIERIMQEQARNHPAMQQYYMMKAMKQMVEEEDDPEAQAVLDQLLAGGLQPSQRGGAAPPNPMQAEGGMPSAGGGPTPQEAGRGAPGQGFNEALASIVEQAPTLGGGGGMEGL